MNKSGKSYSVRLLRDEPIKKNHEKKERPAENKSVFKENPKENPPKENQITKTSSIKWEEEKEIIKQYLRQEYPLTNSKIDKIIQSKKIKYIDIDKYHSFF